MSREITSDDWGEHDLGRGAVSMGHDLLTMSLSPQGPSVLQRRRRVDGIRGLAYRGLSGCTISRIMYLWRKHLPALF